MKNKKIVYALIVLSIMPVNGCVPIVVASSTVAAGRTAVEERPVGKMVDDVVIVNKIRARFTEEDFKQMFSAISVEASEGRVLLVGMVSDQKYVDKASEIAWSVPGVCEVINELELGRLSLGQRTKDSWIATQVRTKFLVQKDLLSVNYTVEAVDGVVYLLGVGQSEEELELAQQTASKIQGVRKVIIHVIVKTDVRRSAS